MQRQRDKKAAKRFFRQLLKGLTYVPPGAGQDYGNDSCRIHTQLLHRPPELDVKRRWHALEIEDVRAKSTEKSYHFKCFHAHHASIGTSASLDVGTEKSVYSGGTEGVEGAGLAGDCEGVEGAGPAGDCEGVERNGVWGWDVPSLAHPPKSRISTMLMTASV